MLHFVFWVFWKYMTVELAALITTRWARDAIDDKLEMDLPLDRDPQSKTMSGETRQNWPGCRQCQYPGIELGLLAGRHWRWWKCPRVVPWRADHPGEFHAAVLLAARAPKAAKAMPVGVVFRPYLSARRVFDEMTSSVSGACCVVRKERIRQRVILFSSSCCRPLSSPRLTGEGARFPQGLRSLRGVTCLGQVRCVVPLQLPQYFLRRRLHRSS
jgi:hypothetical protein